MSTRLRFPPEQEAWLESRVVENNGRSKPSDKPWVQGIVHDFRLRFLWHAMALDGGAESDAELLLQWQDVFRVCRSVRFSQPYFVVQDIDSILSSE